MTDPSSRATFHAVLPLALAGSKLGDDLERAVLQGRTFRHFFRRDQLLHLNVVGRGGELQRIEDALKPLETPWLQYSVIDEAVVHPDLPTASIAGWNKQQIIKMAAPEWLGAPFWMTLDADVICAKPVGIGDLLPGGRALLSTDDVASIAIFDRWAWATRELLGMVAPPYAVGMSVTPLIYAAPIMHAAHQTIEAFHRRPWKDVLMDRAIAINSSLRYGGSWAENQIYYAVGARLGLLRTYHAFCGIDVPQRLHGHGVWREEDWPNWDVAQAFDTKRPGFFSVCNSYTGMPARAVAEKVEPFLAKDPPPSETPSSSGLLDDALETAGGDEMRVRILSRDPLILIGPFDGGRSGLGNVLSKRALEPFRHQHALVMISLPTNREAVGACRLLAARVARRQREAPLHRYVVLTNTEIELEVMRELGVPAVLVSHNALLDERPFFVTGKAGPEFDAVYNAGFHPSKRHDLAAQIPSLALIHAPWHDLPEYREYADKSRRALPQARYLNLETADGSYVFFSREQLGEQLQRARVGLCLSEEEGAMRASIEYLFAGLPVVSTFSRGGRDLFFDDDFCAVVPPVPELIAGAVRELAARNLSRKHVRLRTLHRLAPHRERLMQLVMQALASIGHGGRPEIVWPWLGTERVLKIDDLHRQIFAR